MIWRYLLIVLGVAWCAWHAGAIYDMKKKPAVDDVELSRGAATELIPAAAREPKQ